MATFEGFKMTGIDPNQYPAITNDDEVRDNEFYIMLEPIIGAPSVKDHTFWEHCFRRVVKTWKGYEDLRHYQQMEMEAPQLVFLRNGDNAYLRTFDIALDSLRGCLPLIQQLVEKTNTKYINYIAEIDYFRQSIIQINNSFFRD